MEQTPFFTRDGDRFVPTDMSKGPWGPGSLHGRVVIGLLGAEIERRHGAAGMIPARLTVDMFRLPDLSPLEVRTRLVRDGYRIRMVQADLYSGDTHVAMATAQILRRSEAPPGRTWSPPTWDVPNPNAIPPPADLRGSMNGMWAIRPIAGQMGSHGPRRIWMKEIRDLADGYPFTPFGRVAMAADYASPFANAGDKGLRYINSDLTLYLHRLPVSEWVGFEVINHQATDGVAVGECFVYDEQGPIGSAGACSLAQAKTL
jgi:hypothetical protein